MKLSPASRPLPTHSKTLSLAQLVAVVCLLAGSGRALAQNARYVISTARSVEAIDTAYPYDLALVASRGVADTAALTTAQLLGPHLGKRPVVLVFWMTTCGPCRVELADIEQRIETWRDAYDFAFVPVSLDFPHRRAAFHARAAAYPWESYLDVDREFPKVMAGGLNGVPQVFVFDAGGQQTFHRRKYREGDLDALRAAIASAQPQR